MKTEHAAWQVNFKKFGVSLVFTPIGLSEVRISLKVLTEVSGEHSPRFIAAYRARARYAQAVWTYHEMLAERWRDFGRPSTSPACAARLRQQWDYFVMECRDISRDMNEVTGRGVR